MSHVKKVEQEFIKEIQNKGILHAFNWLDGWLNAAADAEVRDNLDQVSADCEGQSSEFKSEARELQLIEQLMSGAGLVSNYSTSAGTNLMRQAKVSALTKLLNDARSAITAGDRSVLQASRTARSARAERLWATQVPAATKA